MQGSNSLHPQLVRVMPSAADSTTAKATQAASIVDASVVRVHMGDSKCLTVRVYPTFIHSQQTSAAAQGDKAEMRFRIRETKSIW